MKRSIAFRLIAAGLVALFALASGRGFWPEACITLSDAKARAETASAQIQGVRSCCAAKCRTTPAGDTSGSNNTEQRCPLCHIVKGVFDASPAVAADVPRGEVVHRVDIPCDVVLSRQPLSRLLGRSPPPIV